MLVVLDLLLHQLPLYPFLCFFLKDMHNPPFLSALLKGHIRLYALCLFSLVLYACSGGGGSSGSSSSVEPEPPTEPVAIPTVRLVYADKDNVDLEWGYTDAPTAVVSYDLFVGTDVVTVNSAALLTAASSRVTAYSDTSVTADATYHYLLRANLVDDSQRLSKILTVRTVAATVNAPTITSVVAGTETITVNWTGVSDAAGYKIFYQLGVVGDLKNSNNKKSSALLSADVTTFTLGASPTLTAGEAHTVAVASISYNGVNAVSTSDFESYSATKTAVPLYPTFAPPTMTLVAGPGTPEIEVSLTSEGYGAKGISPSGYVVYYGTSNDITTASSNQTTSNATLLLTASQLAASTTYYARASAVNPNGVEGALSSVASATTNEIPLPAPASLSVSATLIDGIINGSACTKCASGFIVTWASVTGAASYQVKLQNTAGNNSTTSFSSATTSATLAALSQGATHQLGVWAVSVTDFAGYSIAATDNMSLYSLAPPPDTVTIAPTTGALIVSWSTATYSVNGVQTTPATYVVHQMSSGHSNATEIASTNITGNSYRFNSTNYAASFYFAISTLNRNGVDGPSTTAVPVGSPLPTQLGAVQNLITTSGTESIALIWDALNGYGENSRRNEFEYIIYWDQAINQFPATPVTTTAASFTERSASHSFTSGETVGGYNFAIAARHRKYPDIQSTSTEQATAVLLPQALSSTNMSTQFNAVTKVATSTISVNNSMYSLYPGAQTFALALIHTATAKLPETVFSLVTNGATPFNFASNPANTSVAFAAASLSNASYQFIYDATRVTGGTHMPVALCNGIVIARQIYCSYAATSIYIEPVPPSVPTGVNLHFAPSGDTYSASITWAWANGNGNQANNFKIYSYNEGDNRQVAATTASTSPNSAPYSFSLVGLVGYDNFSLAKSNFTYAVEACIGADVCSAPATTTVMSGASPSNRGLQYIKPQTDQNNVYFGEQVAISGSGTRLVGLKQVGGEYHIETFDRNGAAEDFSSAYATDLDTNISVAGGVEMKLTADGKYLFIAEPANKQVRIYQWVGASWNEITTNDFSPISSSAIGFADRIAINDTGERLAVFINNSKENSAENISLYTLNLAGATSTLVGTATLEATAIVWAGMSSLDGTATDVRSVNDVAMAFNADGTRFSASPKHKLNDVRLYDYQLNNNSWSLNRTLSATVAASLQYSVIGLARFALQDDHAVGNNGQPVSRTLRASIRAIYSALVDSYGVMVIDDVRYNELNESRMPNMLGEVGVSRLATVQQVAFSIDASSMYVIVAGTEADDASKISGHGAYGAYTSGATKNNQIEIIVQPYNRGGGRFGGAYYQSPSLLKSFNLLDNQQDGDKLGASISTSGSMNVIVFGAPLEDSNTTGVTDLHTFPAGTANNASTPNNNATNRGMILVY